MVERETWAITSDAMKELMGSSIEILAHIDEA